MQSAWTYKTPDGKSLECDDPLPEEINNRWLKWVQEIKEVSKFVVSRYIYKSVKNRIPTIEEVSLHTYTDAGEQAWGIAIYLRFLNEEINRYESHLIYIARPEFHLLKVN